ncbi:VG15 protein [Timonella senegalensis]|uniref:VG15 protein n=1 Tax=Timonella senegalensis TaxID=1465825 RepID=UPI000306C6C0|nr:hypothetical protein [Timonella senegalensis]
MAFEAAIEHEKTVAEIVAKATREADQLWRGITPSSISGSWNERLPRVTQVFADAQFQAAVEGMIYSSFVLADQGLWTPPTSIARASASAGIASSGATLTTVLDRPVSYSKSLIGEGVPPVEALRRGGLLLQGITRTQVRDSARLAASTDIAARDSVSYIRMVGPGACSRCIVLAGKIFRWNTGFKRHPRCNCTHVATTSKKYAGAKAEGYIDDPYEVFKGMTALEQDRAFGKASADAIRDGSDIFQVVNASRSARGLTTSEGFTRRGYSRGLEGRRLTPEGIYRQAAGNRERARELLIEHNYLLPGGQVPEGSIRGHREGFGALGAGGRRVGARTAVEQSRRTGMRDPSSRYTMTAAERRLFDSEARYKAVLEGRNPYSRDGKGLTPQLAAQAEADYKRWLSTGGEVFND